MNNMKRALGISINGVRRWSGNPRIYCIAILIFLFLYTILEPIKQFSLEIEIPATLWFFPFITADWYALMVIMMGVILLFCDAPFINREQPYIILRSGRSVWVVSQFLYILLASTIYLLFIMFISIVSFFPNMHVTSDWGKIINTFSQTQIQREYNIVIAFSRAITVYHSPINALLLSGLLCWLIFIFLGLLIFFLNSCFEKYNVGFIAASILVMLEVLALNASGYQLTYYSPISWASLAIIDIKGSSQYPSLTYVFLFLVFAIILLIFLSLRNYDNKDINISKPI